MRRDTRALLRTGIATLGAGVAGAVAIPLFFGGIGHQGPHTNAGWLSLVLALGCLPTGTLTLFLATLKIFADRRR